MITGIRGRQLLIASISGETTNDDQYQGRQLLVSAGVSGETINYDQYQGRQLLISGGTTVIHPQRTASVVINCRERADEQTK